MLTSESSLSSEQQCLRGGSYLHRVLRISDSWVLSLEQIICISSSGAKGTLWKKRRKESTSQVIGSRTVKCCLLGKTGPLRSQPWPLRAAEDTGTGSAQVKQGWRRDSEGPVSHCWTICSRRFREGRESLPLDTSPWVTPSGSGAWFQTRGHTDNPG